MEDAKKGPKTGQDWVNAHPILQTLVILLVVGVPMIVLGCTDNPALALLAFVVSMGPAYLCITLTE